ncbi:MAG: FAD-dependent oxidoreductase [Candidatus Thermoplasmatota archaeon]|nr:hydrogenase [Euryarchaeota archaeon]MBU4031489.1 FAD-dependent oxidoreductase [Candidatus Thermoplasmatota archaeon]MBU4143737.1 FAD-dependent oxidoreductase [Candidatus Thermoplasmatota archaeon]MBU4592420.1 FAD-dependent oxidoreductase [Candidatus Thermoplasmatota archaeon]
MTAEFKNNDDINKLRNIINKKKDSNKTFITMCSGTGCLASGSGKVTEAFRNSFKKMNLESKVEVKTTGCHGFCEHGPLIVIRPSGIFYHKVTPEDVDEIISETILKSKVVDRLLYVNPSTGEKIIYEKDVPFYNKQMRILFGKNGILDPTSIEEYIGLGGYSASEKVFSRMSSDEIIDEVKKSGLRGRGGAGFPTGFKWDFCKKAKGDMKYIVCNADEGDPGAYMNRSLLEGNPHSVLEGMLIGAFAIGASEGIIYIRHEYPLAVKTIENAMDQMRKYGLLGNNILGSGFNFDIRIVPGAGAFVCGEETALIASIEGKKGEPRQRPPFPAQKGIFGKPTNINNVETWANIPLIINNGAEWFTNIGVEGANGTKIFSLVGKINNTGLVEVPLGTTIREMVYDIGGGIPKGKKFKAIQTGGPSGGCIPENLLSTPIDYVKLAQAGSIMGSGGLVVMDEDTCMVDVAKYFLGFLQEESCGKCLTCREGIERLLEIVTDITEGKGKMSDINLLEELGNVVKDASMCGLGQTAPNSVLSTLRYFMDEYEQHIKYKRCPAVVCKEIISSPCQHVCPIDTEAPLYISLIAEGRYEEAFNVIMKDNPLPSVCARVCSHPCETKCQAGKFSDPISIRGLKRFVTDYAQKNDLKYLPEKQETKKEKIAIIGSGPAGLIAGYYLGMNGYQTTIFESLPVHGGALSVCIPEYRLPQAILEHDIKNITNMGVEIKYNVTVGKDISFEELRKTYQAIFIATGARKSIKLGIPNEDADGVLYSMDFLRDMALGKKINVGSRIGIIGGGNAAVDAARMASRISSIEEASFNAMIDTAGMASRLTDFEEATLIYRRTKSEMPAFEEEIKACLDERVKMQFLTAPKRILVKDGKITGLECLKMELGERDDSGRKRPIPIEGSEFIIELDTLIIAIGERPDLSFLDEIEGFEVNKGDTIKVDTELYTTGIDGVFAGGDVVTGPNTVIEAMGSGKVVAGLIDKYLKGEPVERKYEVTRPSMFVKPVELTEEEVAEARRPLMRCTPIENRTCSLDEVDLGLSEENAIKEARRCLRCDLETEEGKKQFEPAEEVA